MFRKIVLWSGVVGLLSHGIFAGSESQAQVKNGKSQPLLTKSWMSGINGPHCKRLKEILPKQMFKIAIQAGVGSQIVARETISAFRKDVTAKCYGGDISRKRKLLEKQKEGKKRMKNIGSVSIPQDAFIKILKTSDGGA